MLMSLNITTTEDPSTGIFLICLWAVVKGLEKVTKQISVISVLSKARISYITPVALHTKGTGFQCANMARSEEHAENGKRQDGSIELEEALCLAGVGYFHNILLLIMGVGLIGAMMESFIPSLLVPSAQCDFELTASDKGLLNAVYPIGMICGSHMWGFLADTKGRKRILIIAFALDGMCAILSSFSHAFWLFLVFRFLCGFMTVATASIIYAFLGEFHSGATRNKALMWLSIFIGLGILIQPGIGWLVIPQSWQFQLPWCVYKSWRIFIVICAIPNLLCALMMALCLPETPKFLLAQGKEEETLKVLRHMYAKNTGNSPEKYPVKSIVLVEEADSSVPLSESGSSSLKDLVIHMWNQTALLFKPPFLWKTLLVCLVQYGLYASANGLSLWLPDIFNHEAAYRHLHPDSQDSICTIYSSAGDSRSVPVSKESIAFGFINNTEMNFQVNDTLSFICSNETLYMNISNSYVMPMEPNTLYLKCQNNSLNFNLTDVDLIISKRNGEITINFMNTTNNANSIKNLIPYEVESSFKNSYENDEISCSSEIDVTAFQNTLIIGAASAISYIFAGFLIGPLGKKTLIVGSLLAGGISGMLLDHVDGHLGFLIAALAFVTLSGMCITVIVSVVIEIFPTKLRAMAVSLALMFGRLGSFSAHMLMGTLLESNCQIMTYILGCICTSCGILSLLLPTRKQGVN